MVRTNLWDCFPMIAFSSIQECNQCSCSEFFQNLVFLDACTLQAPLQGEREVSMVSKCMGLPVCFQAYSSSRFQLVSPMSFEILATQRLFPESPLVRGPSQQGDLPPASVYLVVHQILVWAHVRDCLTTLSLHQNIGFR